MNGAAPTMWGISALHRSMPTLVAASSSTPIRTLHRPLLEIHPSRCQTDPRVTEPQHAAHHGLRQRRWYGGGRGHEPDTAWWAIFPRCRRFVSGDQLATTLDPDGGLQA